MSWQDFLDSVAPPPQSSVDDVPVQSTVMDTLASTSGDTGIAAGLKTFAADLTDIVKNVASIPNYIEGARLENKLKQLDMYAAAKNIDAQRAIIDTNASIAQLDAQAKLEAAKKNAAGSMVGDVGAALKDAATKGVYDTPLLILAALGVIVGIMQYNKV